MATIYPLPTLGPTIDLTGISIPSYSDVYQSLVASFKQIYGSSIYIEPDSQDGQWIAVLAKAIDDTNQAAVQVFRSFSPDYAQGTNLSSLVKINGIARKSSSNSTAVGKVIGVAGTIIVNGVVEDVNQVLWNLPSLVIVPLEGEIEVTITAQVSGSVAAPINTINTIATPQLGWQSFTNTTEATLGNPVESDPILRQRQSISTSLSAVVNFEAMLSAVGNVPGVTRYVIYENDTSSTDANGIPAHSFSVIVLGGTITEIAKAIQSKKPPGIQSFGDIDVTVYDSKGFPIVIHFSILELVPIYFHVTIKALSGYVASTGNLLKQSLSDFINSLEIGEDVYLSQSSAAASLVGNELGQTYYIEDFRLGLTPSPTGTSNLVIDFNQAASCSVDNILLTVTT